MEKVIVKIKNKRRNSNWHDINKSLNPAPSENKRNFGISYNGSRSELKYLHFTTLLNFSLDFNFSDTVSHILFFCLVNSHFLFLTCGFEFWGGVKTWRSQAKYYSHIHRCQHEVMPVVLLRFILLQLKQTHMYVYCKKTNAFTFLRALKLKLLKSNVHFWVYFFPSSFILRNIHFQVWRWTISSYRC